MYVFRTRGSHITLLEMTQREFVTALESDMKNISGPHPITRHTRTTAEEARQYVGNGGHHDTGLYRDIDGKIRYARADPNG